MYTRHNCKVIKGQSLHILTLLLSLFLIQPLIIAAVNILLLMAIFTLAVL